MIDMLKSQLTNTDDDTHSFMIWLSLVYLTMISQVLVYVSLRFRPNAAAMGQMDSSWKLSASAKVQYLGLWQKIRLAMYDSSQV